MRQINLWRENANTVDGCGFKGDDIFGEKFDLIGGEAVDGDSVGVEVEAG